MRVELANAPYATRHKEVFSGILLENVDEVQVAFEATKRALLRARLLGSRGLFWNVAAPSERHNEINQLGISIVPAYTRLDIINRETAGVIISANAAHTSDVPHYVWHGKQPDTLANAIINYELPFPDVNPMRTIAADTVSLRGADRGILDYLAPELSEQIVHAQGTRS